MSSSDSSMSYGDFSTVFVPPMKRKGGGKTKKNRRRKDEEKEKSAVKTKKRAERVDAWSDKDIKLLLEIYKNKSDHKGRIKDMKEFYKSIVESLEDESITGRTAYFYLNRLKTKHKEYVDGGRKQELTPQTRGYYDTLDDIRGFLDLIKIPEEDFEKEATRREYITKISEAEFEIEALRRGYSKLVISS
ncbi:hypothetical protein C5167_047309 [Papaver somniferum]|uniref:Uncharacterized protein n=1 Tax=Papaver somniferum TaxID=3469 RepID=A0A4Y7LK33_PAPSO|nr:hypothetical protein C5167_047309 [Papaver somniferum]